MQILLTFRLSNRVAVSIGVRDTILWIWWLLS